MNTGIYKIEHLASGKIYVGSAVNIKRRIWEHKNRLKTSTHPNPKLQRAWDKYGAEAFEFSILVICSSEELLIKEQEFIDNLKTMEFGYNLCPVAGSALGIKRSEETKKRMSESQKGREFSEEHKQNITKSQLGNKRKPHSEETKIKMSITAKNRIHIPQSEETKAKRSAALKGIPRSEETKRKISETKNSKNLDNKKPGL